MSENKLIVKSQIEFSFKSLKHVEVEGIPMGVLDDGTPYLTGRGLTRLCGVDNAVIVRLTANWDEEKTKPRGNRIAELLYEQGFTRDQLHIEILEDNQKVYAYTDDVCMAILEYYAFESAQGANKIALTNYRILARQTLRTFIYNKVGYDPKNRIPQSWKHFHDRVVLNNLPQGFFSVFREIADIVIYAIQSGLIVDTHTVPDISVGRKWSGFWEASQLDNKYGERIKYPHVYPDYFPQAKSNPQDVYVYPLKALGEFRIWIQEHYLPENFPTYLKKKVKEGVFPASSMELLLEAIEQKPRELREATEQ